MSVGFVNESVGRVQALVVAVQIKVEEIYIVADSLKS
jgi:hypothetical protein